MANVILVHLETEQTAAGLLQAAGRLGELAGGARVDVLVVRLPPEATILPSEEVLTPRQAAFVREREDARIATLRACFDRWAAAAPPAVSPSWIDIEDLADAAVRGYGARADAIVLPRPTEGDHATAQHELHAALFGTGRPVLVVPPGPVGSFGRSVAIAWRDDRHAVRAVLSAVRSREVPEKLFVLAGRKDGAAEPRIPDILLEHGVGAELHVLEIGPKPLGATLLAKARALGADMLVMGAYAHSPFREFILGGMTRYMLAHADLPVLMRH